MGRSGPDPLSQPWRVVVADDHAVSRSGLLFLLSAEKDPEVVGEATDGLKALELVRTRKPDLLILDVVLPGITGIVVLERLRSLAEDVRTLVISGSVTAATFKQALDLGADALISKEDEGEELVAAIAALRRGEKFLSPTVQKLMGTLLTTGDGEDDAPHLTHREREVFILVAEGRSNKEIARELNMSPATAKKHRERIRAKLGITSVTDATRIAARLGLIKLH